MCVCVCVCVLLFVCLFACLFVCFSIPVDRIRNASSLRDPCSFALAFRFFFSVPFLSLPKNGAAGAASPKRAPQRDQPSGT